MKKAGTIIIVCVMVITTIFTGCGKKTADKTQEKTVEKTKEKLELCLSYTEEEIDYTYDEGDAVFIELNGKEASCESDKVKVSDGKVKIKEGGKYILSGNYEGSIVVNDDYDSEIVRLVLNGVQIVSEGTAGIYVKDAYETIITLPEGTENSITDTEEYVFEDCKEDEPNGTIYSKDNLTINGTGKLSVNAMYNHGIQSKDELKIVSGILSINSKGDGIVGKDSVMIKEAQVEIISEGDGVKSTSTEENFGYVYLDNPILKISAEDDGIHAENRVVINDGEINIEKSYEGIEGNFIDINGGKICITSSDDGINATEGSTAGDENNKDMERFKGGFDTDGSDLCINGGYIYINAGGDGVDSNGTIHMTGGELYIDGPVDGGNGAIDYGVSMEIERGSLVAVGSVGMATAPTEGSTQYSVNAALNSSYEGGKVIQITDSDGNIVLSYTPAKKFQSVVFSNELLKKGETYTIKVDGQEDSSFTISEITTNSGNVSQGMGGHRGGMPGKNGGWPQDMEPGDRPDMKPEEMPG